MVVQSYQTYFFTLAGLPASQAFALPLGTFGLAFVGTASSMTLQAHFGRRTLYLAGLIFMFPCMLLIGILACVPHQTSGLKW